MPAASTGGPEGLPYWWSELADLAVGRRQLRRNVRTDGLDRYEHDDGDERQEEQVLHQVGATLVTVRELAFEPGAEDEKIHVCCSFWVVVAACECSIATIREDIHGPSGPNASVQSCR